MVILNLNPRRARANGYRPKVQGSGQPIKERWPIRLQVSCPKKEIIVVNFLSFKTVCSSLVIDGFMKILN